MKRLRIEDRAFDLAACAREDVTLGSLGLTVRGVQLLQHCSYRYAWRIIRAGRGASVLIRPKHPHALPGADYAPPAAI